MYFPSVPDVPGVPAVPRIPPQIITSVLGNIDQAHGIMSQIGLQAGIAPLTPMGGFLPNVQSAQALIMGVQGNFAAYPSSLFDPYTGPVSDIASQLSGISTTMNLNPAAPLSQVGGAVDGVSGLMGNVSDDLGADSAVDAASLDGVESVTVTAFRGQPQWGIFLSGQSQVEADNVVGFEFRKDWVISDYPVEDGAFQSYDKVETPFDARVQFSCGGSLDTRTGFLQSIETIAGDLNLYDVVTPTKTYQSCNITHYDYRQTARNGVGLMVVDVYLEQVRNTATAAFSQAASNSNTAPAPTKTPAPKAPSAQPQKNGGTKQAQPLSAKDQRELDIALGMALAG